MDGRKGLLGGGVVGDGDHSARAKTCKLQRMPMPARCSVQYLPPHVDGERPWQHLGSTLLCPTLLVHPPFYFSEPLSLNPNFSKIQTNINSIQSITNIVPKAPFSCPEQKLKGLHDIGLLTS
jgi:hypothetical protein